MPDLIGFGAVASILIGAIIVIIGIMLIIAPLKLFSIDKTLKEMLKEIKKQK